MIPARIYKYQAFTAQSLANLKSRSLWFSAPVQFNDPFDCALQVARPELSRDDVKRMLEYVRAKHGIAQELAAVLELAGEPTPLAREALTRAALDAFEERRQVHLRGRGVACFSACVDNVLMWSHYADGHRGLCLEFSTQHIPFSELKQVVYTDEVPTLSAADVLSDGPSTHIRDAMILTKHSSWEYEQEWRLFHMKPDTRYVYDYSLLTGVYLGAAMPPEHRDLLGQLLLGAPTRLYLMTMTAKSFNLATQEVSYTPFQYR